MAWMLNLIYLLGKFSRTVPQNPQLALNFAEEQWCFRRDGVDRIEQNLHFMVKWCENVETEREIGLTLIHVRLNQIKTSVKQQFVSIWLSVHVNTMWNMCPMCVCQPDWEGGEVVFLFFFLLSSLHVSLRNVYRKQTCFLGFARKPSCCCLLFMADWWGRGLGLEQKDRKHRCQVPECIQTAQIERRLC